MRQAPEMLLAQPRFSATITPARSGRVPHLASPSHARAVISFSIYHTNCAAHLRHAVRSSTDPRSGILAAVHGIGANDEIEAMLAVQMVATHFAATRALRRLKVSDTWVFNVARAIYGYPLGPVAQNFTPRA